MPKKRSIAGRSTSNTKTDSRPAERMAPADDHFIYRVAQLAWERGLAPNSILKEVNQDLGANFNIMQVKRALSKANARGILILRSPREDDYRQRLRHATLLKARDYTVVRDDVFSNGTDPVCLAAAEQIVEMIPALLESHEGEVVIGNAGGRSISRTVQYLQAIAPVLEKADRDRLVFIALNSAGRRLEFDLSSNFLAVRLAEIFGGKHIAVLDLDTASEEEYQRRVANIDLLICGVGGKASLLTLHVGDQKYKVQEEMVVDLAFIPLDREGKLVRNKELDETVLKKLRRHPRLRRSAEDGS